MSSHPHCIFEFDQLWQSVIPKTQKMVLDAILLNTPLHLGVVAIEKGAFGSPSTAVANFTLLTTFNIRTEISQCQQAFVYYETQVVIGYLHICIFVSFNIPSTLHVLI